MIATAIAATASVFLIEVIFPIVLFPLMIPFMEIGRRIRRLTLLMWFAGRYGTWLIEAALAILLVFWAQERFGISPTPVLFVEAVCLFHTLAILYLFDAQLFNSMSGIWSIACKDDA